MVHNMFISKSTAHLNDASCVYIYNRQLNMHTTANNRQFVVLPNLLKQEQSLKVFPIQQKQRRFERDKKKMDN